MTAKELTPKLKLTSIQDNMVENDSLISVQCFFSFYGEKGTAYIVLSNLESEFPNFAMTESCSDLHESFNDQLEENWDEIVKEVKKYRDNWILFND